MRISDWSSDVCSSDLLLRQHGSHRSTRQMTGKQTGDYRGHISAAIGSRTAYHNEALQAHPGQAVAQSDQASGQRERGQRARRSEERRVGKECVVRVDLGGRRIIKKKEKQ